MRYFIEELAQWFDSCDAARHFELIVPQRAADCPALLYAIFSTSARHLSRHQPDHAQPYASSFELVDAALEYQNLCISYLISLSGDSTEVQDENLLAATVILRFYEEIDTPLAGVDEETYLRGIQVFLEAQAATAVYDSGLQCAAFWIGCRQEFHTAFSNQRSFRFDLRCCEDSIYRTLDPANDDTWANRVILHCADALMYCYGEETQSQKRFEELWEYNEEWHARKPSSFSPMYYQPSDRRSGAIFPEIWYLDDRKVTAIQHWLLARILLEVFDPRIPRLGPRQRAASTLREADFKSNVFELCGIGLSNKTAPALITSCMGVSMCGDRITDVAEQAALLGLLEKTEKRHSLSTEKIKLQLKETWVLEELERTR
ncbi:hypothetical protein N7541_003951 [Penicillium brevicompactum]|uniref:ARCA protein n=1 Tax=Penicillium brevicompactum TaxID=5074 RepID=A0A9W9RMX2_PENBR|nr:hypothetical protein N7541_003951 [Penicillium brevicompactum]